MLQYAAKFKSVHIFRSKLMASPTEICVKSAKFELITGYISLYAGIFVASGSVEVTKKSNNWLTSILVHLDNSTPHLRYIPSETFAYDRAKG